MTHLWWCADWPEHDPRAEDQEHRTDDSRGDAFYPVRSMRLVALGEESPDEGDRGDRIDRGIEAETQQRQAARRQGEADGRCAGHAIPSDADDGQDDRAAEVGMA